MREGRNACDWSHANPDVVPNGINTGKSPYLVKFNPSNE